MFFSRRAVQEDHQRPLLVLFLAIVWREEQQVVQVHLAHDLLFQLLGLLLPRLGVVTSRVARGRHEACQPCEAGSQEHSLLRHILSVRVRRWFPAECYPLPQPWGKGQRPMAARRNPPAASSSTFASPAPTDRSCMTTATFTRPSALRSRSIACSRP